MIEVDRQRGEDPTALDLDAGAAGDGVAGDGVAGDLAADQVQWPARGTVGVGGIEDPAAGGGAGVSGAKRYRVRYRTPENRTTNKSGFTTRRDAQAFAATVEVSKMSGTYIAPAAGRITVADLARQWLSSSSATVKATTMAKH